MLHNERKNIGPLQCSFWFRFLRASLSLSLSLSLPPSLSLSLCTSLSLSLFLFFLYLPLSLYLSLTLSLSLGHGCSLWIHTSLSPDVLGWYLFKYANIYIYRHINFVYERTPPQLSSHPAHQIPEDSSRWWQCRTMCSHLRVGSADFEVLGPIEKPLRPPQKQVIKNDLHPHRVCQRGPISWLQSFLWFEPLLCDFQDRFLLFGQVFFNFSLSPHCPFRGIQLISQFLLVLFSARHIAAKPLLFFSGPKPLYPNPLKNWAKNPAAFLVSSGHWKPRQPPPPRKFRKLVLWAPLQRLHPVSKTLLEICNAHCLTKRPLKLHGLEPDSLSFPQV